MRVVFRADGNTQIGLGHLIRCLAMAQMLRSEFKITFACKDIPEIISDELYKLNFDLKRIAEEEDFLQVLDSTDIVVLDHYELGYEMQVLVKKIGCKLVCIDDMHEHIFYADLIINPAPCITYREYNAQTYTQFALGLDYVLLRPAFLEKTNAELPARSMETVLVCFGGSDNQNLTELVVDVLKSDQRFKHIHVVVGAAYKNLKRLGFLTNSDNRFDLHFAVEQNEMADLMLDSGLAIVPASGILHEALALQCKVVSGMYAENQKNIFQKFKELGAFESAEMFSQQDVVRAIELSFTNKKSQNQKFIDGKSGTRILKFFRQLACQDRVFIQPIVESDVEKTFEWASSTEIRKYFFSKEAVDYNTHCRWFQKKLNDPMCFYYVGIFEDKKFGSVRFDLEGDVALVSYLIDPGHQNKGLGTILLNKGLKLLIEQSNHKISKVQGEVFIENLASTRVFQKLGYDMVLDKAQKLFRFEKLISLENE